MMVLQTGHWMHWPAFFGGFSSAHIFAHPCDLFAFERKYFSAKSCKAMCLLLYLKYGVKIQFILEALWIIEDI